MTLKKLAEQANQMKTLLGTIAFCIGGFLWMFTHFASAADLQQHIMDDRLDDLQQRKFEVVKFVANCSRQLEDYGSLTIIETEACETAEAEYTSIKEQLCAGWNINCPTK